MSANIYLVAFFLIPAFIALIGITWIAVGAKGILFWVTAYLALLLYFQNYSFGLLEQSDTANFYDRGSGMLFFPAINVLLFGLALQAFVARRTKATLAITHNLTAPALVFWVILAGNAVVGLSLQGVRWPEVFGRGGLLNVANLMLVFYVLTSCIRTREDLLRLVNVFLFCAVTRGVWALVRYVALGGDPANFYANFQNIAVKISFFDTNDNLIAAVSAFIFAWRLSHQKDATPSLRAMQIGCVALELFLVALAHRRVVLGGLALAALVFAFSQRRQIRYVLVSVYLASMIPALLLLSFQRTEGAGHASSFLERFLPDVASGGEINFTVGRFAELYAAYLSLKESPIVGLGTWGQYSDFRFSELAWHGGNFAFMHSGVLHIALKSGLVGVAVMIWVFVAYFRFIAKARRDIDPEMRGIMLAGLAGLLFVFPTWLMGTPVIEFRSMQMIGFVLALPYLAYSASKVAAQPTPPAGNASRPFDRRLGQFGRRAGLAP